MPQVDVMSTHVIFYFEDEEEFFLEELFSESEDDRKKSETEVVSSQEEYLNFTHKLIYELFDVNARTIKALRVKKYC